MRFISAALVATATLATKAYGCVQAHHMFYGPALGGDIMSMQVFVNGQVVCVFGNSDYFKASEETEWCIKNTDGQGQGCVEGYVYCTTKYGKEAKLEYWEDGLKIWYTDLASPDAPDTYTYDCGDLDGQTLKCTYKETVVSSSQSCTGVVNVELCDHLVFCELDGLPDQLSDIDYNFPFPFRRRKMMIVGDSITHGMDGDWTWRWRLQGWLQTAGYDVDFVGPYTGVHGVAATEIVENGWPLFPGESSWTAAEYPGLYNEGVPDEFYSSGHGAWWGRSAYEVQSTVGGWVKTYQPDIILFLLGFNDLGWFISGPDGLIGSMGNAVEQARENKADVQILVGNVVDRLFIEGREDLVQNTETYNEKLAATLPSWFRWESPIAYVDVNSYYRCRPADCPNGYDGLHPNSAGEYRIAQAFADVLRDSFGFKGSNFVSPATAEARIITAPVGGGTVSYPEGLFTVWPCNQYARGYEIRTRVLGMTDWWSTGRVYPATCASLKTWLGNGQTWEMQVRTLGDGTDASDWAEITSGTSNLKTAPGPTNIKATPYGSDGILMTWDAVPGYAIDRYGPIIWDKDTEGAFINMQAASGTSYTFTGLNPGHRYGVYVSSYVSMVGSVAGGKTIIAGGLPSSGREIFVGGGTPAAPANLAVTNIDPTSIQLSWNSVAYAAGYAVYYKTIKAGGSPTLYTQVAVTQETTQTVGFLFPGTWTYQFCVAAYNGNVESAYSGCVVPPVYPGYTKRDVVQSNTTATGSPIQLNVTIAEDKELQKLYQIFIQDSTQLPKWAQSQG